MAWRLLHIMCFDERFKNFCCWRDILHLRALLFSMLNFFNHRSALENLSSLEKKYSEQAKTMQQEMLVLQKHAEGTSIKGLGPHRWQVTWQTRWIKCLPFLWTLQLNVSVFSTQAGYWRWPKPFFQDEWQLTNYLPIIPKKLRLG